MNELLIHDAYIFVSDLIRSSKHSIVLTLLSKRDADIKC